MGLGEEEYEDACTQVRGQLLGTGSLLPQDLGIKLRFVGKCSYLLSQLAGPATYYYLTRAQGHSLRWAGVKSPACPQVLRLCFLDVWLASLLGAGGARKQLWAAGPGRLPLPGCSQPCGSAWDPEASFPLPLAKASSHDHESAGPQEFPDRAPQW